MIANKNVEIEEQESGTYVFPAIGTKKLPYTWALFVYKNGDAELYTKRGPDGTLLGKPIKLVNPWDACKHEDTETIPKGDLRNPYRSDNTVCKNCGKEFRTLYAGKKKV